MCSFVEINYICRPMNKVLVIIISGILALGCSDYSKILKSKDYNLKFEKAKEYYHDGECSKALPLLEELLSLFRLTAKGEDVYYYYAKTNYCSKEYFVAAYYFKNFVKTYPGSERAEECLFLGAMCNVLNSPKPTLDQTETIKAINDLQLFMNRYPESSQQDTCNTIIQGLRKKLEVKALNSAKLYYHMERYNSAQVALGNLLIDYPDTQFKEEILFLMVKASFMLADNSIQVKKEERFKETLKSYYKFADAFPDSDEFKEAEGFYNTALKELDKIKTNQEL